MSELCLCNVGSKWPRADGEGGKFATLAVLKTAGGPIRTAPCAPGDAGGVARGGERMAACPCVGELGGEAAREVEVMGICGVAMGEDRRRRGTGGGEDGEGEEERGGEAAREDEEGGELGVGIAREEEVR